MKSFLIVLTGFAFLNAAEYLLQGNSHYKNGYYKKSAAAYRKAIANHENSALAWFNLGNALYQDDRPHRAIACYKSAVVEEPAFARAWQNLGVLYFEEQDYGACIAALDHVRLLDKENNTVISVLAAAHKELEHYGRAAVYLEQVLEKDATLSDAYLMLYEIARTTGDDKEALAWLKKYPASGEKQYEVLLISGELLVETGDTAGALAALRRNTRLKPERAQGWRELVSLLHRMGTTYSALMEAEKGIKRVESPVHLALQAGRYAFEAGYHDKAEFFYSHAFAAGHADGVAGLGNLLLAYERYGNGAGVKRIRGILDSNPILPE